MNLCLAAEMAAIDRRARDEYGLTTRLLMENAGAAVARVVHQSFPPQPGDSVLVAAGAGNNGGDGLVAARHLCAMGRTVHVVLAAPRDALTGAAGENLAVIEAMGLPVLNWPADPARVSGALAGSSVVVDAILGTGLHGEPGDPQADLIRRINASQRPVVAVDIPSGVVPDSGQVPGAAIQAAMTVTFGLGKPAHFTHPGAALSGRVVLDAIGLPAALLQSGASGAALSENLIAGLIPRRRADAHKGTSGRVLILGGSEGLTGAPRLCAAGALRSGAGLVTIGHPDAVAGDMTGRWPDIMTLPLPSERGRLCHASLQALPDWMALVRAVIVGPGLGVSAEGERFVQELLEQFPGPVVIDADALPGCRNREILSKLNPGRLILTPHPGEMARLRRMSTESIQSDRLNTARRVAEELGTVTVLKGAGSVVAMPDGRYFINTTGNPGMAVGGTGDVLAGVIGGLLAQGLPPGDAAICGVYVHGLAGDMLAVDRPRGFLASELADQVPAAIRKVESRR